MLDHKVMRVAVVNDRGILRPDNCDPNSTIFDQSKILSPKGDQNASIDAPTTFDPNASNSAPA